MLNLSEKIKSLLNTQGQQGQQGQQEKNTDETNAYLGLPLPPEVGAQQGQQGHLIEGAPGAPRGRDAAGAQKQDVSYNKNSALKASAPGAPGAPAKNIKFEKKITPAMLRSWRIARPWLLAHLMELQAAGWTRAKLFRAGGRLRFPFGPWGIAFLPVWTKPGVQIEIEDAGAIRWTWVDATGKTITQAARPKH